MTAKQYRPITILLFLAFAAGSLALSRVRPLDGDEGYYASAARLVAEEGLSARFARHRRNHLALVAGIEAMGLAMVVAASA